MHQASQLVSALKKLLRAKGLTYRDIARALQLSEASVKRIFANESFSLRRLEEICQFLDLSLYELARLAAHEDRRPTSTLTVEQETALAEDPQLFSYFYLLVNGWIPSRIKRRLRMEELQSNMALLKLNRLKLIELFSRNRVRLLTARTIAWRKNGPVRRQYEQQVRDEFLGVDFDGAGGQLKFETAELSESSAKILQRRIDKLVAEFHELAEVDVALPDEQRRSVGFLVAARPWVFSLFAERPR
jgi:transcriptional regulator with XRE-family HTH domain